MNQHQNNKNDRYNKVNITPFVAHHSPQRLNLLSALPAAKAPAVPAACAGRQNKTDDDAGKHQTKQTYKTKQIDNEIKRNAFHKIPLKHEVLSCSSENFGNCKVLLYKNMLSLTLVK